MKLRYYLRGLGIGMLVAALVLILSGSTGGKMSDEEVKQRAMQLGMVEKDTSVLAETMTKEDEFASGQGEEAESDASEETAEGEEAETESEQEASVGTDYETKDGQEASPGAEADTGSGQGASAKTETERENSEETETEQENSEETEIGQENTGETETDQNEQDADTAGVVTFVVKSGDSSVSVAKRAKEMGLVESADEFDSFLCQNGYDRKISVGSYQISVQASMKEIADKITRR